MKKNDKKGLIGIGIFLFYFFVSQFMALPFFFFFFDTSALPDVVKVLYFGQVKTVMNADRQ